MGYIEFPYLSSDFIHVYINNKLVAKVNRHWFDNNKMMIQYCDNFDLGILVLFMTIHSNRDVLKYNYK